MVNLLWLTTWFVIKISLYGLESDAKRVTKKGKRGQKLMRRVFDFLTEHMNTRTLPNSRVQAPTGISYREHKSSFNNVTTGQSMPLNFIKVTL